MELRTGNKVFRYTLVRPLGKGGQGAVWEVIDPDDRSLKALKLLDLAALATTAAERARREAKAVRDLSDHPAIVPCHVLFDLPEDVLGLVFDLVPGPDLSDVMRDPRMTTKHRIAVLRQIASALAHVHSRDLVHRDIKPSNILLTKAFWNAPDAPGSVKLVDFGIVAPVSSNTKRITVEGRLIGTAPYLAPELLSPQPSEPPPEGFTQDIFAFGVLGFELFVGAHPTGLSPLEKRAAFAEAYRLAEEGHRAWPPPGLDREIAPVLTRCLALDPARRIPNGGELARLLGVEVHRASRPSLKSLPNTATTASHSLPTDVPVAPRSSARAYTTPQEAPPAYRPRTRAPLGSRPPEGDWAPPPPHRSSNQTLPWIVSGFLLLCVVGGVSWYLGRSGATSDGATNTNQPSSSLLPDPTTDKRAAYVPIPCCGSSGACKSDWPCSPGDCGAGMPERWYRLRISGIDAQTPADQGRLDSFSDDYSKSHPRARICVTRPGANERPSCSLLTDIAATKKGDSKNRARVSTADLEGGGLEISVEENGVTLARGRTGVPLGGGFLITALCDGIKLYLGPKDTSKIRVWAYLDPG